MWSVTCLEQKLLKLQTTERAGPTDMWSGRPVCLTAQPACSPIRLMKLNLCTTGPVLSGTRESSPLNLSMAHGWEYDQIQKARLRTRRVLSRGLAQCRSLSRLVFFMVVRALDQWFPGLVVGQDLLSGEFCWGNRWPNPITYACCVFLLFPLLCELWSFASALRRAAKPAHDVWAVGGLVAYVISQSPRLLLKRI